MADEGDGGFDLEDGFNMTVRTFDRAWGHLFPTGAETYLMERAREASWTAAMLSRRKGEPPPPALPFRLNISDLARKAGRSRTWLSEVHAAMVAKGYFAAQADGTYRINKDFRKWLDPETGEPLLAPAQIEDCMEATAIGKRPKRGRAPVGNTRHPLSVTPDTPETAPVGQYRHPLSGSSDTPCRVVPTPPVGNTRHPLLEERTRRESLDSKRETTPSGLGEQFAPAPAREATPPDLDPRPTRFDPSGALPGDVEPDPAELARAVAFIDRFLPMLELEAKVRLHARHYPSAWFLKALKRARLRGESVRWGIVQAMLRDWGRAGRPEPGPEDGYDDEMKPVAQPKGEATPAPAAESVHDRRRREQEAAILRLGAKRKTQGGTGDGG